MLGQNGKQDIGLVKRGDLMSIEKLLKEYETIKDKSVSQEVQNYSSNTVIELLKKSLNIHWQQTTTLTAQAVHLERWGYKKLAAVIKADADQEHEHAAANIKRLEFFDVDYQPFTVAPKTWARHDMFAMIKYNLNSVREAAAAERESFPATSTAPCPRDASSETLPCHRVPIQKNSYG